ncbi:GTP pyrophosphokinase [Rhynchospora pubera]|uniref:GTP diphosphokinase n=1 Tax=Rhynchospora pubera TaxID=906938 RepID=A0AAV8HQC1_9POAL|nr:GTP pyrophosphokinase [Rhynchospora pubera]KAJ4819719.1 GTP pyrophosphokinase [Rhynchospora pubera]
MAATLHPHPGIQPLHSTPKPASSLRLRRVPSLYLRRLASSSSSAPSPVPSPTQALELDRRGGKMVAQLVGAFNDITERMGSLSNTSSSSQLLFQSLKLSISLLQTADFAPDSRLSRALAVAFLLADLQMDAEVISAGILREALEAGLLTMNEIKSRIGPGPAHLLHESLRMKHAPMKVDILDDDSAAALRKFCLTFYDIRALVLELALKLDSMRNLEYLPKCQQIAKSLEVIKIYAPLAHAVGAGSLSLELEDLSFRYLFPFSYGFVDAWLRSNETESKILLESYKEELLCALSADQELQKMLNSISIESRYKSRFSTMKKLLKDGRKPEEVNDILGLRVILDTSSDEWAAMACYKTHEVIRSMWREIPERTKDYITKPKGNGYRSLHVAVDVGKGAGGQPRPLMEVQIRTAEMHRTAVGGAAAHSMYKGGLTDPEEAKRLKAIMVAAAEVAAVRLRELGMGCGETKGLFCLLDKNMDGRISIEELMEVIHDLGADSEDAKELMRLLDANCDGFLSAEEFDIFQRQVEIMRSMEDRDDKFSSILKEKFGTIDSAGLIQVYRNELDNKLVMS